MNGKVGPIGYHLTTSLGRVLLALHKLACSAANAVRDQYSLLAAPYAGRTSHPNRNRPLTEGFYDTALNEASDA
ncbi:MAG: hypothetical protein Aurels2KO_54170 [Aureliella sp.]